MATKIKGSNLTSSTFIIPGDLQVDGTTTTINSTTLTVDDKNLVLASGAGNAAAADGAGLTIDGASATFTYAATGDKFGLNKTLEVTGDLTVISTDAGVDSGPVLELFRNSASPADNDVLGRLNFIGKNDAGENVNYGSIFTSVLDASDGTEDGRLILSGVVNGSLNTYWHLKGGTNFSFEDIELLSGKNIRFEGSTSDNYETTLTVTDPTADRTITLPDATGTLPILNASGHLDFIDSTAPNYENRLRFGAGNDLQIFSDGTNGFMQGAGNNDLTIAFDEVRFLAQDYSAERMRIASDGKVGIGTASPGMGLHISGSASSNNYGMRVVNTDASGYSTIQMGGTDAGMYRNGSSQTSYGGASSLNLITVSGHPIAFSTSNALRMQVDGSGNVTIAGTSITPGLGNTTTGHALRADGIVSFSGASSYLNINRNGTGTIQQFSSSGNAKGSVTIASNGVTYGTTSDIRLKQDIEPLDATDKLMAMNPVSYKWKADPDGPRSMGFIAQEMQEIMPNAVSTGEDADATMSMDYGRITPIIVSALQKALQEIDILKDRIAELEAK